MHGDRIEAADTLGRKCWAYAYNAFMYALTVTVTRTRVESTSAFSLTRCIAAGGDATRLRCGKHWQPMISMYVCHVAHAHA